MHDHADGRHDDPLVSVVVIFLNGERFIEEAIDSIYAQTYRNWELLLVDDGSTDSSTLIARQRATADSGRVRYLTHDGRANLGMSASRNLGIRHARGKFVALLDADDVWLPDKLAKQVAILRSQPEAAMVYGRTEWWYSWTGKAADQGRDFVHELGVPGDALVEPPTLLARFLVDEGISPCTCSMLVRREVLESVGGFEESFRGLYEDQALCAKICLDWRVYASSDCSYRYRQHPDSALYVAERTGGRREARALFLTWLARYLRERNVTNAELWAALRDQPARASGRFATLDPRRALARLLGRTRGTVARD
jgi:glycosyltransferase involved in cell wall biosynthesis